MVRKRNWLPWWFVIAPVFLTAMALFFKYQPFAAACTSLWLAGMVGVMLFNFGAHRNDPPEG